MQSRKVAKSQQACVGQADEAWARGSSVMYKVLIVDDEPLIREGLTTLIDWREYGFEVVHAAKDGQEALRMYEHAHPDLLIVDIRMPGMDGLQLIETIRQQKWDPKLLILSGYADFAYAMKAIRSKVEGYILKPVDEDELIEYLQRIKLELDRQAEEQSYVNALSEKQREAFIQSVLTGSQAYIESVSARASELDLIWKQYQVLLLLIPYDHERQIDVMSSARRRLTAWAENKQLGVVFSRDLLLGVLLRESYVTPSQLDRLYKQLQEVCDGFAMPFYAAIGHTVYRFVAIKDSYDDAFEYLKRRFYAHQHTILSQQTAPELHAMISRQQAEETIDLTPLADKLYYAIDVADHDRVRTILGEVQAAFQAHDVSEQGVKTTSMQMLTSVMNRLLASHEQLRAKQEEYTAWIVQLYKYHSMQDMFDMVEHRLLNITEQLGNATGDSIIKRMIDLIHRNYHENLKLESLAKVLNYNSAYLGKLFKNHTGEYFNTYLDKVRIQQAKLLLEEGLKVYQVAERVGFTNVDYFHSKFKKYTGVAPSAYRSRQH